jgi:hypothetical protein
VTQRLIVFTDTDDNTMLVHFGDDRLQLSVIDSRPALAGHELRRFAAELFRAYAAAPLRARIADAEAVLDRAAARKLPARARDAIADARAAVAAVHAELTRPPPAEQGAAEAADRRRRKPRPNRVSECQPVKRGPAWQRPAWLPAGLAAADLIGYRRGDRRAWPSAPAVTSS